MDDERELDGSERARLRQMLQTLQGNGRVGLIARVETIEQLTKRINQGLWILVAIILLQLLQSINIAVDQVQPSDNYQEQTK